MTLIDGDKIVTAHLYDDEHEAFTEKEMSIIDYVNAYTDEGVTTADDVLDNLRAEIDNITDTMGVSYNQYLSKIDVMRIIDRYRNGVSK